MHSRKRIRLLLCSLALLTCCQKADLTVEPDGMEEAHPVVGTGGGTAACPYTVTDVLGMDTLPNEAVWVIGYMVGTAPRAMSNAVFSPEAENQSNILLASDSLCKDASQCIPIELSTEKNKLNFSLPTNATHFGKCLLIEGTPSTYLYTKGLRKVSTGLWMDGFDISTVAPQEWGSIDI